MKRGLKTSKMKITITISEAEEKGIKDYLKEVDEIKRPSKRDVQKFISSYIDIINSPQESVSTYILRHKLEHNMPKMY
jgi:hypothetical protein